MYSCTKDAKLNSNENVETMDPQMRQFQGFNLYGDPALDWPDQHIWYGKPISNGTISGFGCDDVDLAICHYTTALGNSINKVAFGDYSSSTGTIKMAFIDPPHYGNNSLQVYSNTFLPQDVINGLGLTSGQIITGNYNVILDPFFPYGYMLFNVTP